MRNVAANELADRVEIVRNTAGPARMLDGVVDFGARPTGFDFTMCNPPFFVRRQEPNGFGRPSNALEGGGMRDYAGRAHRRTVLSLWSLA